MCMCYEQLLLHTFTKWYVALGGGAWQDSIISDTVNTIYT